MAMLDARVARALVASDRHIAVTGSSGWLGRATLDLLMRALGEAFTARVSCYGSSERDIELGDGRFVRQRPLSELATLDARRIWLLHFAFQAKERAETMTEAAFRQGNQQISDTVLEALDRIDIEALFIASSGAVAKADDPAATPAMRLYGCLKRADEHRFSQWGESRERRVVIARIFNLTGPYINKHDNYAIASFLRDGLAGRPIAVRAPHPVVRSYVAIRELLSLVLALMGEAADGVVRFDSGGEALELGEVAHVVSRAVGGRSVERAPVTVKDPDYYVGDYAAYAALLAHHRIQSVSLVHQIVETAPTIGIENDCALSL